MGVPGGGGHTPTTGRNQEGGQEFGSLGTDYFVKQKSFEKNMKRSPSPKTSPGTSKKLLRVRKMNKEGYKPTTIPTEVKWNINYIRPYLLFEVAGRGTWDRVRRYIVAGVRHQP